MNDREKAIKGLEICIADLPCSQCPYDGGECGTGENLFGKNMLIDALSLLKEVTQRDDELRKKYEALREAYDCARKKLKSGCDGCECKGSEDCPMDHVSDGNVVCPNGKLSTEGSK